MVDEERGGVAEAEEEGAADAVRVQTAEIGLDLCIQTVDAPLVFGGVEEGTHLRLGSINPTNPHPLLVPMKTKPKPPLDPNRIIQTRARVPSQTSDIKTLKPIHLVQFPEKTGFTTLVVIPVNRV